MLVVAACPAHAQDAPAAALTLREAVATALERNPTLAAASAGTDAARARTGQSRAYLFPQVDFSQGFTRGNNPVFVFGTKLTQRQFTAADFALPSLNAPTPVSSHQSRLEGRWLLFDSFARESRMQAARRLETAADFSAEQARQDVALSVVRAYSAVLVAREGLRASEEALRTAEAIAERIAALEKAGLVVSADLLSARVFRAHMKEREIRASNAVQLALLELARQMAVAPEQLESPGEALSEIPPPLTSPEEWERRALAGRPALRAAEMEAQAAESGAKAAQRQFGPKLGAFASFEREAETLASGPSGTNWTAGIRLEVNLFAGGGDRARLAEANARKKQVHSQLEWFRSGVRLEVRQSYLETQAAQQRVEASRGAFEQARESLRILQNRYEAGLATLTDLLRAQTAALEARTSNLAALSDALMARAALERAAGSLTLDSEIFREAKP
jgi:outer membrane protein TolC